MLYILSIAICIAALLQMGMWISFSVSQAKFNRAQLDASRRLIQQQIFSVSKQRQQAPISDDRVWEGYREFYVDHLEKNVASVTSVYLKPLDEKSIVGFKAGQHLSLKFHIPGEAKPVVRCYSLSTGPGKDYYRISVKAVASPPDKPDVPAGKVSNFINQQLIVGDRIEVRAPSGSFFLDDKGDAPIVLLAGGIGITPMFSMLEDLVAKSSQRLIVLFYGVRCGHEHTFKEELKQFANQFANVHVVNCYSDPDANDQLNTDYHVRGFVSVDLLKTLLPDNKCKFYMCGPPPFMQSIRDGLLEWQVPENRIRFEAFGPASIKKTTLVSDDTTGITMAGCSVRFAESEKSVVWNSECDSILDLAEANGITLDSGCRAGSCGTCVTKIIGGSVEYPDGVVPECGSDECLACIAKPKEGLELDA